MSSARTRKVSSVWSEPSDQQEGTKSETKAGELSRRAQTAPTERSSALNDTNRSDVRRAVAATITMSPIIGFWAS